MIPLPKVFFLITDEVRVILLEFLFCSIISNQMLIFETISLIGGGDFEMEDRNFLSNSWFTFAYGKL